MDLLKGRIRPLYFKYPSAAFGSALISSIYGIVDMAMVGQYQGPQGTAAMAVISPIWNIIYSLGLLMGIGGSVLLSTLRYALGTTAVFGLIWTALCDFVPNLFIHIFMQPTAEILAIAPFIVRSYGLSFSLLPLNIFSTYYFQALLKPRTSFIVSVGRGALVSGMLIYLMPLRLGANAIWFAMPLTEAVTAVFVIAMMPCYTKAS